MVLLPLHRQEERCCRWPGDVQQPVAQLLRGQPSAFSPRGVERSFLSEICSEFLTERADLITPLSKECPKKVAYFGQPFTLSEKCCIFRT